MDRYVACLFFDLEKLEHAERAKRKGEGGDGEGGGDGERKKEGTNARGKRAFFACKFPSNTPFPPRSSDEPQSTPVFEEYRSNQSSTK